MQLDFHVESIVVYLQIIPLEKKKKKRNHLQNFL